MRTTHSDRFRVEPREKAPPIRKTQLTDEITKAIAADIEKGVHQNDAAAKQGVTKDRFHEWKRIGRNPQAMGIYRRFEEATEKARHNLAARACSTLVKYATEGWTAVTVTTKQMVDKEGKVLETLERTTKRETMIPDLPTLRWWLERFRPEDFNLKRRIEHSADPEAPIDNAITFRFVKPDGAREDDGA